MERERIGRIVESAIADYGGNVTKSAVVWHLKHTYGLDPADAILQPAKFLKALRDIYGDFASIIEANICDRLAREYGIDHSTGGLLKLSKQLTVKLQG